MAFSQQSYAGQGIVQPMAIPTGAPALAAGIEKFGSGVSKIIDAYANKKAEDKRKAGVVDGLTKAFTQMGVLDSDAAKTMSYDELVTYGQFLPQLVQQQAAQQQQGFMADAFTASQPQMVEEPLVDNQMIEAARQRRNEASMAYSQSLPSVIDAAPQAPDRSPQQPMAAGFGQRPSQDDGPSASFLQQLAPQVDPPQPVGEDVINQINAPLRRPGGARSGPKQARVQPQAPADNQTATAETSQAQANPLLEKLNEAQQELDLLEIRQREGDSNIRQETADETNQRFSAALADLVQKYPKASKLAFDMVFTDKQTMTPSEQLAFQKYRDEYQARTIPGLGTAPSIATATELRGLQTAYEQVDSGVDRLLEILEKDFKSFSPELRAEANVITGLLTGALRVPITGPGAFSESEKELIDGIVANPTRIFSMDDKTKKSLETLRKRIKESRDTYAKSIGITNIGDGEAGREPVWDGTKFR